MKLDLHVHSVFSYDSRASPESIVERARRLGLDGVVITEHNSCLASADWDRASRQGLLVLHGAGWTTCAHRPRSTARASS